MTDRELASREKVRRLYPNIEEIVDPTEIEEEEYQCETCRGLAFLSFVTVDVRNTTHIACPNHAASLPDGAKVFRVRFDDNNLRVMLAKVKSRSDKGGRARPSLGEWGFEGDQRTTGRKRKPSALAIEAAGGEGGEEYPSASSRARFEFEPAETGDDDDYYEPDDQHTERDAATSSLLRPEPVSHSSHSSVDVASDLHPSYHGSS